MTGKPIWIPMGDFRLEGELHIPDGNSVLPSAVIAHPHPQFGGDMHNNVVEGVYAGLSDRGRAVLRFNLRGVGRSGGLSGNGEAEDLEAAVDFLAQAIGDSPRDVAVVGYSYGAVVANAAMGSGPSFRALVAIAPPLAFSNFSALESCGLPVYAICGDRDEFCDPAAVEALIDRCPSPRGLAIVPGADHFFGGDEAAVAAQVELFLGEVARTQ